MMLQVSPGVLQVLPTSFSTAIVSTYEHSATRVVRTNLIEGVVLLETMKYKAVPGRRQQYSLALFRSTPRLLCDATFVRVDALHHGAPYFLQKLGDSPVHRVDSQRCKTGIYRRNRNDWFCHPSVNVRTVANQVPKPCERQFPFDHLPPTFGSSENARQLFGRRVRAV